MCYFMVFDLAAWAASSVPDSLEGKQPSEGRRGHHCEKLARLKKQRRTLNKFSRCCLRLRSQLDHNYPRTAYSALKILKRESGEHVKMFYMQCIIRVHAGVTLLASSFFSKLLFG